MELLYRPHILARDDYTCVICQNSYYTCGVREEPHIHHIKTRGSGGKDNYQNLITLCHRCHTEKAHGKESAYYRKFFLEYTLQYEEPVWWFETIIIPTSIQRLSSFKAKRRKTQSTYRKSIDEYKQSHNGFSPSQVAYRRQKEYLKNKQSLDTPHT